MDTDKPDVSFKPLFKLSTDGQEDIQITACDTCGALIAWNTSDTSHILKHGKYHTETHTQH